MEPLILGEDAGIVGIRCIRTTASGARITAPSRCGRLVFLAIIFRDDNSNRHANGNKHDETNKGTDNLWRDSKINKKERNLNSNSQLALNACRSLLAFRQRSASLRTGSVRPT